MYWNILNNELVIRQKETTEKDTSVYSENNYYFINSKTKYKSEFTKVEKAPLL